ncbi:FAD-dependent monooxygenase [Nonomuraea sp. NPDC046802]|uniref:FAD-dependent monooxygenase n=1 Tax=Nonomuraea sp. NPDC046802 TaxID=3154919 RepID=UPI0033D02F39
MEHERVPVLVVGGGYAGLSAATLLAWREVPVMLVERRPGTSVQPKTFGASPRAVELLRPVPGLEEQLSQVWTGIGVNMRADSHMITSNDTERAAQAFLTDITPAAPVGAPQTEIERVLRAKAEELGAELCFSTELISLEQDDDGVTAVLRTKGVERVVRTDYVVAADGYESPVRRLMNVPTSGKGELGRTCSIMFDADLTGLVSDGETTLWHLRNDLFAGAIVTGCGAGAHVLGVNYSDEDTEADFTDERCVDLVRAAVGRPGLDVQILDKTTFPVAHLLADTYRCGRVFFAGDAAHTMPPTGGQAGSLALQDGCDLAWRLWLVLTGQAGPSFLDTYDAERRPIGTLTATAQLAGFGAHTPPTTHAADYDDHMPPAARVGYPEPMQDPASALVSHRYHSAAILTEPDDDRSILENPRTQTGRPGSRAPHVVLDWDGQPMSTIDLFGSGFVLMADKQGGQVWTDAGRLVKERLGVQLTRLLVDEELMDVEGCFRQRYGVRGGGAVLVRPDGYVAWRSPQPTPEPAATLERVLRQILSRSQ